jgi:cobalamin biosynthesis protein CobD/CbiB
MNEVLHANIFFLIASIATVVFCILTCIILFHVIKIVKAIRSILERIEAGSEKIAQDVAHVRSLVSNGGVVSRVMSFMVGAMGAGRRNRSKKD